MTRHQPPVPIRRILLALDASGTSVSAMEAAVQFASRMEAELLGLFVEDVNLLRFAALPFAREVGFPSARTRRLGSAEMERALRAQASLAQTALTAAAMRQGVRCSFRIVRGEVPEQVLEAANEVDLIAIGMTHRQVLRVSSATRLIAGTTSRPVLLLPSGASPQPPVLAVYDGSPESAQALLAAGRLAKMGNGVLTVLVPDAPSSLRQEIATQLEGSGLALRFNALPRMDLSTLMQALYRESVGTLVLGANLRLQKGTLDELLQRLNCAVLLIR